MLAKQVAELERQWTDLDMAIRRSATVRRFLVLVVVAVLGVYLYLYYSLARGFLDRENLNRVAREVQNRALPNLDAVLDEVRALLDHTGPAVMTAFSAQFEKDMPTIKAKLEPEWKTLLDDMERRLNERMQNAYYEAQDKHQAILAEEFPNVKDAKDFKLMGKNLDEAIQPLIKRFYGKKIRSQLDQLDETWQEFPQTESRRDREELADELYHLLIALLQTKASLLGEEDDRKPGKSKVVPASGIVVPEPPSPGSGDKKPADKKSKPSDSGEKPDEKKSGPEKSAGEE
ncbi:MAG: hypothetical protein HY000_11825 [Planctomycetes bacterium]|nr:hypothetical protein [Planctomycetota bacterium]